MVANSALLWSTLSAIVSAVLVGLLVHTRKLPGFTDLPNERSLHATPTPRLGGIGMLGAVMIVGFAGWLIAWQHTPGSALDDLLMPWIAALLGTAILLALGICDDRFRLKARTRLAAQSLCAVAFATSIAVYLHPEFFDGNGASNTRPSAPLTDSIPALLVLVPLLALAMIWSANLFNFMDGSDGLAGSTAALGFSGYALLAPTGSALQGLCAITAGAASGFLVWNWAPARVFLGDAGSVPLGWLAAAMGTIGAVTGAWPWTTPLLIFAPFVCDATLTLLRRVFAGKRFWEPHREHAYQKLVLSGVSHPRVAGFYALLMLPGLVTASTTRYAAPGVLFTSLTVIICCNAAFMLWASQRPSKSPAHRF